jgi:hypothetical protein
MNTRTATALAFGFLFGGFVLTACNSGGGSTTTTAAAVGLALPTEVSAVPADSTSNSKPSNLKAKLLALGVAATDSGTDYSNATTTKFVDEHTLDQFDIVGQVLKAVAQTNYADASNVDQGPYKAMVAFQDEQNGVETKSLEPWTVDSAMITENGQAVNRVRVWIDEIDNGMPKTVKAELKVYTAATQNSDGSYADYGVWTLNAKFDDTGTNYFAASASIGTNGETILKVHENQAQGPGFTHEVKAILNKSETNGYGKVSFPDWSTCTQPDCAPPATEATYAYDATHLAVQKGADPIQYKDRTSLTEMTRRYGLYNSVTGEDVFKTKSFGFPIQYTDTNGNPRFAYYGAWQGRHQLWAGSDTVPAGTVVTRQDHGSNQTAETYTVSDPFVGTLTKRTLVAADVSDIVNIPVETWVNQNMNLMFDGANWNDCQNPTFGPGGPTCGTGSSTITDFGFLVIDPNNNRKFIGINRWDNGTNTNIDYMYVDNSDPTVAGFYVATRDPNNGSLTATTTKFNPSNGDQLWVNIGGSIYIEYTGSGWVEKTLSSFDQRTWTPVFDNTADQPYTLPLDREYYINNRGANYVVKRTDTSTYDAKIEIQTVANPVNAATFLEANTTFKPQWTDTGNSTYQLITDSADPNFLKLVYVTVGTNDSTATNADGTQVAAGDVVRTNIWGLAAWVGGVSTGTQFNWEYPREGENWGTITYLMNADNTYKLLDDPISLSAITVTNNVGQSKTLSLQYDGWMHGLPDMFEELRKADFVITSDISDKVINIPAGTEVVNSVDSTHYLIKPLEVSQYLNVVADPGDLDITVAADVDLTTVPVFVEHGMGAKPDVSVVKYSEGKLVE